MDCLSEKTKRLIVAPKFEIGDDVLLTESLDWAEKWMGKKPFHGEISCRFYHETPSYIGYMYAIRGCTYKEEALEPYVIPLPVGQEWLGKLVLFHKNSFPSTVVAVYEDDTKAVVRYRNAFGEYRDITVEVSDLSLVDDGSL